jgi:hypothetical protein
MSERSWVMRARALWAVVLAGLGYGVVNTVAKVIDLFSG